jgi:hypothetical protein
MHGFQVDLAGRAISRYADCVLNFILVGVID